MTTATVATEETTDLEALLRVIPHTITPPLKTWVLAHADVPKLVALLADCAAAEERLNATRRRVDEIADLMAKNDDALAATTDATRAKPIADRANLLAEAHAMPEMLQRHAEAKALTALRLLRAIRFGARTEVGELVDELQPLQDRIDALSKELIRNENAPRDMRMTAKEQAEHRGRFGEIRRDYDPLEQRRAVAHQAYQGARLAADRAFSDSSKGVTVNLDVASEKAWVRVVSHYAARYLTETLGAQPLRLVA